MSVESLLNDISKDLNDATKVDVVGEMATGFIRGHIYTGKGNGKNFDPLSPATTAYRGAGKPLQDTGALRDSISYEKKGSNTVIVGTNKVYAQIHNEGGTLKAKKNWLWIPASGTRQLQRKFGYSPTEVCNGLRQAGTPVFRVGRTMCYNKGSGKSKHAVVVYFLKKEVKIPKREFFFLSKEEINQIIREITPHEFV